MIARQGRGAIVLALAFASCGCVSTRTHPDIRVALGVDEVELAALRAAWSSQESALDASRLEAGDRSWVLDHIAWREGRGRGCWKIRVARVDPLPRNYAFGLDGGFMWVQYYHEQWRVRACDSDRTYNVWGDRSYAFVEEERHNPIDSSHDPNAVASNARIVGKRILGERHQAPGDATAANRAAVAAIPVFEYRIRPEDGEEALVVSEYFAYAIGDCVTLFRSSRPTYPRIAPSSGCK